jgi:hypothetical protein
MVKKNDIKTSSKTSNKTINKIIKNKKKESLDDSSLIESLFDSSLGEPLDKTYEYEITDHDRRFSKIAINPFLEDIKNMLQKRVDKTPESMRIETNDDYTASLEIIQKITSGELESDILKYTAPRLNFEEKNIAEDDQLHVRDLT